MVNWSSGFTMVQDTGFISFNTCLMQELKGHLLYILNPRNMKQLIFSGWVVLMIAMITGVTVVDFSAVFITPTQDSIYPLCIQEKIAQSKKADTGRLIKPAKFINVYRLADGRHIYAFSMKRPEGCMDCSSGMYYVDSLCKTIADFRVGNMPRFYIDTAYTKKDFERVPGSPLYRPQIKSSNQK